jgi:hypothetical protein
MKLMELKEALAADKEKAEEFKKALAGDECKACGNDAEAFSLAAHAVGFELSPEEVERAMAEGQELDTEELKRVAGGKPTCDSFFVRYEDNEGHDAWCMTAWHCFVATLHTEGGTEREACLSNYFCLEIYEYEY